VGISFQEKSLWLSMVALIVSFGLYLIAVLPARSDFVLPSQAVLFALVVVLVVITQIAGNVVITIIDRRTETDERDRLIELMGARNGGYVLATGVFFALCTALVTPGNFAFTHLLLGFWVLAQLTEIGSQLFLYRRGA